MGPDRKTPGPPGRGSRIRLTTLSCTTNQLGNLQHGLGEALPAEAVASDDILNCVINIMIIFIYVFGGCWCRRPRPTKGCRAS
jgi:hypothetical protein